MTYVFAGRPRPIHSATALLMASDPWLPPYTSTTRPPVAGNPHFVRAAARSGSGEGGRSMGAPVVISDPGCCARRADAASGKLRYISYEYLLNARAVSPGKLSPAC